MKYERPTIKVSLFHVEEVTTNGSTVPVGPAAFDEAQSAALANAGDDKKVITVTF